MSAAGAEAVARVTDAVSYLRVEVREHATGTDPAGPAWLSCTRLCTDADALAELARATAAGRGTDRDDVALSLFVQGCAFRVASVAIGAWLLDDLVLDLDPRRAAIALGRDRPDSLRLDDPRLVDVRDHDDAAVFTALHRSLIDEHLALLVDTAHRACRVGRALLWSNVGAACASSFGAFMAPLPDRRSEVRERAERFFSAARPELGGSGRLVPVGSVWAWERRACCLWYRTEAGSRCADCSLWTVDERQARYDQAVAAEVAPSTARSGS